MNLTATIFAFLVLFLSIQQPVLRSNIVADQEQEIPEDVCPMVAASCESKKAECPEEDKADKCCQECVCNPFGSCCCYLPAEKIVYTDYYRARNTKIAPVNEDFLSSYISDFWNPPESAPLT